MFEHESCQLGVQFCSVALVADEPPYQLTVLSMFTWNFTSPRTARNFTCRFPTRLLGDGTGCGNAALLHSCQTASLALGASALGALAMMKLEHPMAVSIG